MFATLAEHDILLCHPYDSYEPVVRFIEEAADDPDVLAIKQTLYIADLFCYTYVFVSYADLDAKNRKGKR